MLKSPSTSRYYGKAAGYMLIMSAILSCNIPVKIENRTLSPDGDFQAVPAYTYEVINTFPHDAGAFTQGIVFDRGVMYEGTGLFGESSLRKVDLATGKVTQVYNLPTQYYGEGITIFENKIIQLTLESNKGFVYDKNSFDLLQEFSYPMQGWGITHDGKRLIMSDGTPTLYMLDTEDYKVIGQIEVRDKGLPLEMINELEYIDGKIYANIWKTNKIAIIDPGSGQVRGWVDLSGILNTNDYGPSTDVLNGIAYDADTGRLFVTGKLWPKLFEIKLVPR